MSVSAKIAILNYHRIREDSELATRSSEDFYCISRRQFTEQLKFLKENGFSTPCIGEFLDPSRVVQENAVILTFDDGYLSDLETAAPLLKAKGFRAIFFVCIEYIGQPGYMGWREILALQEMGMSIQCHGLLHHDLARLRKEELEYELKEARSILGEKIGSSVDYLALPGGFASSTVYDIAEKVGFRAVFNSVPGLAARGRILKRIAVRNSTSLADFGRLAGRRWTDLTIASMKYKTATHVKRLLGVERYEQLKTRWL